MSANVLRPTHQTFRIGAVSRLTGVSTDLIRMWERRYAVVNPLRTDTGTRLYSQDDIARLALIKHLVDAGDAIGTIATLHLDDLEGRAAALGENNHTIPMLRQALRVAVVGHALTAHITRHKGELGGLEFAGFFNDIYHLFDQLEPRPIDVVAVEVPCLTGNTPIEVEQLIDRTGAVGAVIVYGFGSRRNVRRLQLLPVVALRAPADVLDLQRACLSISGTGNSPFKNSNQQTSNDPKPHQIQPRRFDDDVLAQIATLATSVECECPHHLADLVFGLSSFEQYSADCASKNEDDATIHRYLHAVTAQARSQLETALARLIKFEGLKL